MKRQLKKWASGLIVIGALAGLIAFTGCEQRVYVCGKFDPYKEGYCRQPLKQNSPMCHKHTAEHARMLRMLDRKW